MWRYIEPLLLLSTYHTTSTTKLCHLVMPHHGTLPNATRRDATSTQYRALPHQEERVERMTKKKTKKALHCTATKHTSTAAVHHTTPHHTTSRDTTPHHTTLHYTTPHYTTPHPMHQLLMVSMRASNPIVGLRGQPASKTMTVHTA